MKNLIFYMLFFSFINIKTFDFELGESDFNDSLFTEISLLNEEQDGYENDYEIEDEPIDLDSLINSFVHSSSKKDIEHMLKSDEQLIKLLKTLINIFNNKKINQEDKNNLKSILHNLKNLTVQNYKKTAEQTDLEEEFEEHLMVELQKRIQPDISKILKTISTLNKEDFEKKIGYEKIINLINAILDIIIPLADLKPALEKSLQLFEEVKSKTETFAKNAQITD